MRDHQKQLFIDQARFIYKKFPLAGREVLGTEIRLVGEDILRFLENANEIVIMAVTLGFEADKQIEYAQKISLSQALDLDRAANRAINEVCNRLQDEIASKFTITKKRYSCGYGDFPLEVQPDIIKAMDATKTIGLYCNENNLMIPTKSVTAIMGVLK